MREKIQNTRVIKKVLSVAMCWLWIVLLFALTGCADSSAVRSASQSATGTINDTLMLDGDTDIQDSVTDDGGMPAGTLEVHFIDVGQADATLIKCDGQAMLIDAGTDDKGTAVWNYIRKQGISELDYLILTHPHEDHIGGADVALTKLDVSTIMMPELKADTAAYRAVIQAMKDNAVKNTVPSVGSTYALGEASFTVVAPSDVNNEETNDHSVGILLQHGENKFLFTGDAEKEAEYDMIKYAEESGTDIACDVYKVGHHGSKTASSEELIEAVSPEYAVISCGEDNDYGHPHAEVLNRFRANGIKVYRTDEQGSIVAVSDGEEITWNAAPAESWKAGEATRIGGEPEEFRWIVNIGTKKIHYPSCGSVEKMKPENTAYSNKTIAELKAAGYVPCGNCEPSD